jgi:lipopolysaccharide transport system ATP-binding protein
MAICGGAVSDPVIIFNNVSKAYPLYRYITGGVKHFLFNLPTAVRSVKQSNFSVLENITFSINRGETFGIIGRNGVGKSTTLGLMAGVLKPSKGIVEVKERVSPLLELGMGFHPELNGRENIEMNGVLLGLSRKEVLMKMEDIIHFSEIGDQIDHPLRTYSTGMLARLGFSVVVHIDPRLILIDEILAVGDLAFREKCSQKMLSFKDQGITMVIVSHSPDTVENLCDRVLWIQDRTVKMIGSPKEVVEAYSRTVQ